jgi:hypothetical protein
VWPTAVIWDGEGAEPQSLPDFGNGGVATGANASIIVGDTGDPSITSRYWFRLTLWDADGTNPRLATGLDLSLRTRCFSVNSRGTYVGSSYAIDNDLRGIVGRDGTVQHMSYPGFDRIIGAADVNEADLVVGGWAPPGALYQRGFVAEAFGDEIHDLGLLDGFPGTGVSAINDHGAIVGAALAGGTHARALYWPPGATEPIDFNTMVELPSWETLVEAIDINNAGQILARGYGGYYVFTPVPEPSALGAVVVAVLARPRNLRDRVTRGVH